MAADAGLGALPHFDLNGGAGIQIVFMNAKTAAGDLNDGVCAIDIEILMQAALTCIVKDTKLGSCPCEAGMRIIADGTIAHG